MKHRAIVLAVALLGGCTYGPKDINPAAVVERGHYALESGWIDFCRRNPAQCRGATPATIHLSQQNWDMLEAVNQRVNANIIYTCDADGRGGYCGEADQWDLIAGFGRGDCEDYAITKRAALIEKGVPAGALRVAIFESPRSAHAVLAVITDKGTIFMDNESRFLLTADAVAGKPKRWHSPTEEQPNRWAYIEQGTP